MNRLGLHVRWMLAVATIAATAACAHADPHGAWTQYPPAERLVRPGGRFLHSLIADPSRNRFVAYGGVDPAGNLLDDVWTMTPVDSLWQLLDTEGGSPAPRSGHAAVYDPVRDRMIVIGGSAMNDVWELTFSDAPTWTQLTPTGTPPSARSLHSAIYDPLRDRVLVFGGQVGTSFVNDTWELSLGATPAWSQLATSGLTPAVRGEHDAFYDPIRDRMVILFGRSNSFNGQSDMWALSLAGTPTWARLFNWSTSAPAPRYGAGVAYDPVRDQVVAYGGSGMGSYGDTWVSSLGTQPSWQQLTPGGVLPGQRLDHGFVYDAPRDRFLSFGGHTGLPRNDLWALHVTGGGSWNSVDLDLPRGSLNPVLVHEPVSDRLVLGVGDPGYWFETWTLPFGTAPWRKIANAGTGNIGAPAFLDSSRSRALVYQGTSYYGGTAGVFAFSLGDSIWSLLTTSGTTPTSRDGQTGIFDPVRDRLVIFGGQHPYSACCYPPPPPPLHCEYYCEFRTDLSDVWELSLSETPTWSQIPAEGTPTVGTGATSIYDPIGDRMVVYGLGQTAGEVWTLDLSGPPSWTQQSPMGTPPPGRSFAVSIYDPLRQRMVVFGGENGILHYDDVWALYLDTFTWVQLLPAGPLPSARSYASATYDALRDRMIVFGGTTGDESPYELWYLTWGGAETSLGGPEAAGTLLALDVNPLLPANAPLAVRWSLATSGDMRLAVYDVRGVQVGVIEEGVSAAGPHVSRWDARGSNGRRITSGVYFVRLEVGGRTLARRVSILD